MTDEQRERAIRTTIVWLAGAFLIFAAVGGGFSTFVRLENIGLLLILLLYVAGAVLLRLALIFGIPILILVLLSWLYSIKL